MNSAPGVASPLVEIPTGDLLMGSSDFYPEEGPVRQVHVDGFAIEPHPVTNRQFAAFVADTGYVTVAERALDPADFPGADPQDLVPGGLVFTPTAGPVDLRGWQQWWRWQVGASWRQPSGPGSDLGERQNHPVVLVAHEDALAYTHWVGRELPTEAELEYAARGGTEGTVYAWGDEVRPGGELMANTWQGRFPYLNTGAKGWVGTSPVGQFPANGYGLVDLIGNVWEWTSTYYLTGERRYASHGVHGTHEAAGARAHDPSTAVGNSCCSPSASNLRPTSSATTTMPTPVPAPVPDDAATAAASVAPGERQPRMVLKGGSHLCAPEYCLRYRPAARSPQSVDSATTHIGFRCVVRSSAPESVPTMPTGARNLLAP